MQKIISWNVASVRARLPVLLNFLEQEQPDVVLLQEIKATEETFPFLDFQLVGYQASISGQKGYNGVAILTKSPMKRVSSILPGFEEQARFIQAEIGDNTVLVCVYVPNGNPPEKDPTDTSRLIYKLKWFQALTEQITQIISQGKQVILGGDFNVIERETDVYNPDLFRNSALMIPDVQKAYQEVQNCGLANMIRHFYPNPNTYTFWDFQGGAWPKNNGILLDALLVSPELVPLVQSAKIYKNVRAIKGTSDHAPIGIELRKWV